MRAKCFFFERDDHASRRGLTAQRGLSASTGPILSFSLIFEVFFKIRAYFCKTSAFLRDSFFSVGAVLSNHLDPLGSEEDAICLMRKLPAKMGHFVQEVIFGSEGMALR